MNRSTQNRLIVGAMTVLLAASTAAVASSVERAGGEDATLAAGQPAGSLGGGSDSPPAPGPGAPSQPSVAPVSSGSRPTGPSTSGGTGVGAPVAPTATPSGGTGETPDSGGAGETADPGGPGEEVPVVDAAVLTPLLRTLAFGTNFAVKGVGCNLGGSLLVSATSLAGLSELASSAILDGVDVCVQLAATSIVVLEELAGASTALNVINPVVDPLLELLATNVEILGTRYAAQLAPLGDTIATLGPTIRYLIGEDEGAG